jgi:hypothetical protein
MGNTRERELAISLSSKRYGMRSYEFVKRVNRDPIYAFYALTQIDDCHHPLVAAISIRFGVKDEVRRLRDYE